MLKPRYKGRQTQSENWKLDEETSVSRKVYLFHTEFSPCSIMNTCFSTLLLDYNLISTFTPLGRSNFIKASTVF